MTVSILYIWPSTIDAAAALLAERTLSALAAAEFLVGEASQVAIIAFG